MYPRKGQIDKARFQKAMEAKAFFLRFLNADCDRVAIENPRPLKIVDCLDFLRRKARENRFQNELVIVLIVEPCQQGFLGHKLFDRFIVIPNLGVFLRDLVFEDKKPIVGKHLAVENEWFKVQRYHLLILHPIVAP